MEYRSLQSAVIKEDLEVRRAQEWKGRTSEEGRERVKGGVKGGEVNEGKGERRSYYPRIEGQQEAVKARRTRAEVVSWERGGKRTPEIKREIGALELQKKTEDVIDGAPKGVIRKVSCPKHANRSPEWRQMMHLYLLCSSSQALLASLGRSFPRARECLWVLVWERIKDDLPSHIHSHV
ncbi:hypothetical protein E2C01_022984 [Portunus trituberculatus]|uniref:Uncharacterized protein n=1 Tax=Portunus trituberculatus TaxID=210409 RepID=A0A5B7E8R7_PORTR|nr:hypothetical protein [Portunus trituberculatus]